MRILCDLHHQDLFKSLLMLFEDRLCWEVYRPKGIEWFDQGYWRYLFPARETAAQFLGVAYNQHKGVTLDEFAAGNFDFVLSSTPPNFHAFEQLRLQLAPKAKHIFQSGNDWVPDPGVKNFLNSTKVRPQHECNEVYYHQEFSLSDYRPDPGCNKRLVASFMHYVPSDARQKFHAVEKLLPDFEFRMYGAGNRDGQPGDLPAAMREIGMLWHSKPVEAYGFNVHYAAACGKPIFLRSKLNERHACADLGNALWELDRSSKDVAYDLQRVSDEYQNYSTFVRSVFDRIVNFDREFEEIKRFLERCS